MSISSKKALSWFSGPFFGPCRSSWVYIVRSVFPGWTYFWRYRTYSTLIHTLHPYTHICDLSSLCTYIIKVVLSVYGYSLKGQCHEIFDFRLSAWISFPQAPDYTIRAVSNFFKNSLTYSQLKVHHRWRWHRWQMEKNFNLKNFHYFFWAPLGSRASISINFFLQVHFKLSEIVPIVCHRHRWHLWQICLQYHWHLWQICCRYRWHRWQICRRYQHH